MDNLDSLVKRENYQKISVTPDDKDRSDVELAAEIAAQKDLERKIKNRAADLLEKIQVTLSAILQDFSDKLALLERRIESETNLNKKSILIANLALVKKRRSDLAAEANMPKYLLEKIKDDTTPLSVFKKMIEARLLALDPFNEFWVLDPNKIMADQGLSISPDHIDRHDVSSEMAVASYNNYKEIVEKLNEKIS